MQRILLAMTPHAFSSLVFDAGPLAAADLDVRLKRLVLRTAVHAGLRWIYAPGPAAQQLAGRALFDLKGWRSVVPLAPDDLRAEARASAIRLRRSSLDLALLPATVPPFGRAARELSADPFVRETGYVTQDAARLIALLRSPRVPAIALGPDFDRGAWREPGLTAAFAARPDLMCMAARGLALAPGVTHTICAADSPRDLARLFAALGRPRRRDAVAAPAREILSEAA